MASVDADQIVDRVLAALRPEIEALRHLVERAPAGRDTGPLLTREELAAAMRLSKETIKRWHRDGCPRVDIGERMPRYRLADVLAWRERWQATRAQQAAAPKAGVVRLLSRGRR